MSAVPSSPPRTLVDGTLVDCAAALVISLGKVLVASQHVAELLTATGSAGARGDTADDLKNAIAIHGHLVHQFNVKVRTEACTCSYQTQAPSASIAFQAAEAQQNGAPCGITVTPTNPDRAALAAAHRSLAIVGTLDHALKNPALNVALHSFARKHRRRNQGTDFKSLAANDHD